MKKIVTIIGARPQFIKTPLVSREIRRFATEILVHTGQHYDPKMSAIFFKELKIPRAKYNLGVNMATQGKQTGQMMEKIEAVLLKEKPDMVIIYGDTNSTIAGALAAVKLHIPVAHIESGMRSYNRAMPEEINRVVSDHISTLLFASTRSAVKLLKNEGLKKNVFLVGDVAYDVNKEILKQSQKNTSHILKSLRLKPKNFILATVHRQENTDSAENLERIFKAFESLTETIVYPIHPRTKKCLEKYGFEKWVKKISNLKIIEPVGILEMMALESQARLVITDSGGVQKEAYLAKVPCLTLRQETEWTETVESGWNQLVGADTQKIIGMAKSFPKPQSHPNFLGQGDAYRKITKIIKRYLD